MTLVVHADYKNTAGGSTPAAILFVLLITVAASFFTYNLRVVQTTGGFHLVKKSAPAFDTPYVDITGWGIKELFNNRQITYEVINAGYGSEIPYRAAFQHALDQGIESLKELERR